MIDLNNLDNDVVLICNLISTTLDLPIYFFDNNYSQKYSSSNININDKFKDIYDMSYSQVPIIKLLDNGETYLILNLLIDNKFLGTFILGPTIASSTVNISISSSYNNLSFNEKQNLKYDNSIKVMSFKKLLNTSQLVYYLIYNTDVSTNDVIEESFYDATISKSIESSFYKIASSIRKDDIARKFIEYEKETSNITPLDVRSNDFFHKSIEYENELINYIKSGGVTGTNTLRELLCDSVGNNIISLNKNKLREHKNYSIAHITLASRAAINSGLPPETAYMLSNCYIQMVEDIDDMNTLYKLNLTMISDFAKEVSKLNSTSYSKIVRSCMSIIHENIYSDISLNKISTILNFNQSYISRSFKKELGISISEFILKEKIQEAKRLLVSSNYSILNISVLLSFHDQSYFSKIFKRFERITPKKYKDDFKYL